jgi:hypothetical protein
MGGLLPIAFALLLVGCAKRPTEEQCRAAWIHVGEVQIDEMDTGKNLDQLTEMAHLSPDVVAPARELAVAHEAETKEWLRSQLGTTLMPQLIAFCQRRLTLADYRCTMAADSSARLVKKCHWRVVPGPRGPALGLE